MAKNLSATLRGVNYGTLPTTNGGTGVSASGTTGNVLTSNGTTWASSALPIATSSALGVVKVDNSTLTVNASGVISVIGIMTTATANSTYLALAGGTLTGSVIFGYNNANQVMFKDVGFTYLDNGTTNTINYKNGSHQRWAPSTGAQTLTVTNWPSTGNLGELLIEGVNLGASTITWPTINWVKNDGTTTTAVASNGVTFQASGTDWVFLWSRDAGTTIYAKVVR